MLSRGTVCTSSTFVAKTWSLLYPWGEAKCLIIKIVQKTFLNIKWIK